jgi:hypothetical protein
MENYSQRVRRYPLGTVPPDVPACVPLPDTTACDDNRARITFASREVWAELITLQQTDDCEPRGDRYEEYSAVRRIQGDDSLSMLVLGDSGAVRAAHGVALRTGFSDITRGGAHCPEPSEFSPYDWGIVRIGDAWTPTITVSDFGMHGLCQFTAEVAMNVPDSIGGAAPTVRWDRAWAKGKSIVMVLLSKDAAEAERWYAAMPR